MPLEEQVNASRRALNYSPSRGSSSSRLLYSSSLSMRQQRSSQTSKKPPEPLRRAVADCLSAAVSNLQATSAAPSSEASRTLRDYLANPATTDMAYNVLIEHALSERDRSPAAVPRCVALLKRYLLRCIPKVQTLRHIDQFCESLISECDSIANPRLPLWSKSLSQQPGTPSVALAFSPSVHASNFASPSLVKSLNYVRALVARHIPKLSQSGWSASTKQTLPTLSTLLSRSFTSHLSPEVVRSRESPQMKEGSIQSASILSSLDKVDEEDSNRNISLDLLTWRWCIKKEQPSSCLVREGNLDVLCNSDGSMRPHDVRSHGFLEGGAAALLLGVMEAKARDQSLKYSLNHELPDVDQLLEPSAPTTCNFASCQSHLKAITASKRSGPHQTGMNVPVSTYHPRSRPLFQYRHYSEQQPLKLNPAEICEVIAEVCSESDPSNTNLLTPSPPLANVSRQPPTDVAVSVLVKLVIDMYMMDCETAAPLALSMLEDILSSQTVACRIRAFDLILNLGVHAHLLEPVLLEESLTMEDGSPHEAGLSNAEQPVVLGKTNAESSMLQTISAIDKFESWILVVLFETLWFLVQTEEQVEIVWASALSCLFYFVCLGGKILRSRLQGLNIRVIKSLLEISRKHSWAEIVHSRLICMLANMFYRAPDKSADIVSDSPIFLVEQVDLLGGIDFICLEYSQAKSREEKRNLFLVLFDYALYQINDACLAAGLSAYAEEEIQLVASMLSLVNAPEAFFVALKHGLEGIGEILRRPISSAMSRSPNFERLDQLLDKVTRKLEVMICMFTCLDNEFSYMVQITKSYRLFDGIEGLGDTDVGLKVRLCWATLHSLLHSDRSAYHHNGYIWLAELLLSEVGEHRNRNIWGNIRKLQQQIGVAGSHDVLSSSVSLPISMLCGLLKSKHNYIRWGFLFVLEKLLMRLKLLLDESELQSTSHGDAVSSDHGEKRLEKANAVIDIMSCALSLVVQINETDRTNILKMCDILFSQLCLRLQSPDGVSPGNSKYVSTQFDINEIYKSDSGVHMQQNPPEKKNAFRHELPGRSSSGPCPEESNLIFDTASMAALLLRGHAIVPMQLVARVPASLFYWPLIQLAGAATDDIALDVAVGSKGGGNLPGATSDIRAALLLFLIGKCSADPTAFLEVEGEEFFRGLLDDTDSRVAYYASAFLLKRMMTKEPENYQRMLQKLIIKAQQSNNEKLLENPYLQMRGILKLMNDPGA